jgi:DNA-binding beta-propeller fold protein YncE
MAVMAAGAAAAFGAEVAAMDTGGLQAIQVWQTEAVFRQPESAVFDPGEGYIYISNVDGAAGDKDGKGFISRLTTDGKVEQLEWLTGLHAPKGMAIVGDRLYVADIDALVEIDIPSAAVARRYEAAGAKFLNDVTADAQGAVYVSDMMTDTIHRLQQGRFEVWLQGPALQGPNGLLADGDRLLLGTWGVMVDGFKTDVPGHVKVISLKDRSIADLGSDKPIGNMDGIELLPGGMVLATDWMNGALLTVAPDGKVTRLLDLNQGSADHDYLAAEQLAVVPMMNDGIVTGYRIEER